MANIKIPMTVRHGLESNLRALREAELGFTTDTQRFLVGSSAGNVELSKKTDVDGLKTRVDGHDEDITSLNSSLADKTKQLNYVTPEQYGAKGDGVADDTTAIQQAIQYGKDNNVPIHLDKIYFITSTLMLDKDKMVFICNGTIKINTDITAIRIKCCYGYFFIHNMTSVNNVGTFIELYRDASDNANLITSYNKIEIGTLVSANTGLRLYADGTSGVQYNEIRFSYIYCNTDILLQGGNTANPWVAENKFYGGRIRGVTGVKSIKGTNQTDRFNGNKFYNLGFESITDRAISLDFADRNAFINSRMGGTAEFGGNYWVYLTNSRSNFFQSVNAELNLSKIYDDNAPTSFHKLYYNRFECWLATYGSDSYGGRKFISYNNKFYMEDAVALNTVNAYGASVNFNTQAFTQSDFYMTVGGDAGVTCVHTLTEAFGILITSFYINCSYKNSTCTVDFKDSSGNVLIPNANIVSGKKYRAMYYGGTWSLLALN